uniref:Gelsolin-like domain-containing protein n=1 Tax=Solanum lycopersicum TaxID=4081 RepID=A0A3Q7IKH9_SOLLC
MLTRGCPGKFEVEEIYNFTQDDLLTEDVMVLDTHAEVFVWVGQSTDSKEKQSAFEIGQKYVELATSLEGLSSYVPLYKVTEGNEPCFFTTFFSWDPVKATAHGNSFQKKVMILFGFGHASENHRTNQDGPTQRASALAALNSAFTSSSAAKASSVPKPTGASQSSQRAAAVAALSNVLTEEMKQSNSRGSSLQSSRSPSASPTGTKLRLFWYLSCEIMKRCRVCYGSVCTRETYRLRTKHARFKESEERSEHQENEVSEHAAETNEEDSDLKPPDEVFSYEQLKAKSENPATGIDTKRREVCSSSIIHSNEKAHSSFPHHLES